MPDDIERIVIEAIARRKPIDPSAVSRETTFASLGFDSLDGLELVFALEERFDINVPDGISREMQTVGDVVDALKALDPALGAGGA